MRFDSAWGETTIGIETPTPASLSPFHVIVRLRIISLVIT